MINLQNCGSVRDVLAGEDAVKVSGVGYVPRLDTQAELKAAGVTTRALCTPVRKPHKCGTPTRYRIRRRFTKAPCDFKFEDLRFQRGDGDQEWVAISGRVLSEASGRQRIDATLSGLIKIRGPSPRVARALLRKAYGGQASQPRAE
jgi:hypothetical protein